MLFNRVIGKFRNISVVTGVLASIALIITSSVNAGLIATSVIPVATTVGAYSMTGFALPSGVTSSSATSFDGDIVNFTEKNMGVAALMDVGDSNNASDAWWSGSNSDFYFTDSSQYSWVELIMPSNTLAFSLTIDAKSNASAWIMGVADDGSAIDTNGNSFSLLSNGNFSPNNPAYSIGLTGDAMSYGFYADNSSGGACNTLSKVIVDPVIWGMGDFSIHVDENACDIPEPSVIALFGMGFVVLACIRRRTSLLAGKVTV
jgi:hypothetical protein